MWKYWPKREEKANIAIDQYQWLLYWYVCGVTNIIGIILKALLTKIVCIINDSIVLMIFWQWWPMTVLLCIIDVQFDNDDMHITTQFWR